MKILILLLSVLIVTHSFADTRSYDRTWLGLFNKKKVAEDYSMWAEAQARMDNDEFTGQQILLRTGLLKTLDDKNEAALMYGYIITGDVREHRPTLQYAHTFFKNETSTLSLRNRFEYRKLENNDTVSGRYRAALRYQKGSYIIWDEPFLNITHEDWTGNRLVERNRFFVGKSFKFQEMNLEAGYMNQYVPRSSRTTSEHILTLYLFY